MARKTLQSIVNKLPVTGFVDYRDFLDELYQQAKAITKPYSYEAFASDLGFSATNSLRLVIVRERQLSVQSAQTIVKALDLRRENRKYFMAMVNHVNARSAKQKALYFQKMLESKQQSIMSHQEKDQLEFLSEWYHWTILEILRLDNAKSDPEWISNQMNPRVSPDKVRRSLALLESLNLIVADPESGNFHTNTKSPMLALADAAAGHLAMTRHHQAMLDLALKALVELPAKQREFNALTVNISFESFEKLRHLIRTFCEEALTVESGEQKRDCVAQLNINLFSLSKWEQE